MIEQWNVPLSTNRTRKRTSHELFQFFLTYLCRSMTSQQISLFNMATDAVNTESLINAIHNESSLWDSVRNASEEDKELAWRRVGDAFGANNGTCEKMLNLYDSSGKNR